MKESTIVIIAPQRWDFEIGSNARNIALEFAKKHQVIYVNPPSDWNTKITQWRNNGGFKSVNEKGLTKVGEGIWELSPSHISLSINWLNHGYVYRFLARWNNERFAKSIRTALTDLGIKEFIIFNDNYIFNGLYLKEILKPRSYIYYIRDFLTIQPYFKKHGALAEAELIKKSDAVVANSIYLKEYAEQFNKKSFDVGQGCEVDMFNEDLIERIPSDLEAINSPIIGYIGFLTSMRLSIQLLVEMAQHNENWNLVLVGPEDNDFQNSPLHQLKNVHFLGRREPSQLPAYVKGFDVCINPQEINQLTIGNYPRKVDEYLAMGKPTVATATKAMEVFKECAYLATDNSEFIRAIETALSEKDEGLKQKRIALARSHTWENSVKEIYKVIDQLNPI
jgi:glycosyltransferase involved in cell wall biosynthesis